MKKLEEIAKLADKTRREVWMLTKASEYIDKLKQENTNLKMQIDKLIKKYEHKIINCTYSDIYTIEDDDFYVNGERLTQEFIDDLSKLKEVKK